MLEKTVRTEATNKSMARVYACLYHKADEILSVKFVRQPRHVVMPATAEHPSVSHWGGAGSLARPNWIKGGLLIVDNTNFSMAIVFVTAACALVQRHRTHQVEGSRHLKARKVCRGCAEHLEQWNKNKLKRPGDVKIVPLNIQ